MVEITISEKDRIAVNNEATKVNGLVEFKLGEIMINIPQELVSELYEKIEQAMWDKAHWSTTLQKEVDELQDRIDELEDIVEFSGIA